MTPGAFREPPASHDVVRTDDVSSSGEADGSLSAPTRAQKNALDSIRRHVRRRNAIRRVLEDVDQELQTAVDRARAAGAVDEQIVAAALAGQQRTKPPREDRAVKTNSEVLHEAQAIMADPQTRVHCGGDSGAVCSAIAIWSAQGDDRNSPAVAAFRRAVGVPAATNHDDIYEWNDAHPLAEVLAAFDRAIAIAEAEEAEHVYGDPLPALEPAEMDLATVRAAIAAHDAREAGDSRLLTAIREATDTRVDEDRELAA